MTALATFWRAVKAGWTILADGRRAARPIGESPKRDHARVFNLAAVALLAIILLMAVLDGPLAALAKASDPDLTGLFRAFTDLAKSDWILATSALVCLGLIPALPSFAPRARAAAGAWIGASAFVFASIAASGIAVNVLKIVLGRGRPRTFEAEGSFVMAPLTIDSSYASFPSGHATTAFALAAGLALFMPRLRVGLLALAATLALSRVVIGAHYVSDIVGGAILGVCATALLAELFQRRGLVFAVRRGQLTPKAPRALRWPLRRLSRN